MNAVAHIRNCAAVALLLAGFAANVQAQDVRSNGAAADLAAFYLISVQAAGGTFRYDHNFSTGGPTGEDNIVRQAGTAFSLAEHLRATGAPETRRAVRKALKALWRRSAAVDGPDVRLVSGNGKKKGIRAGATALALLTETLYYRASGDGRFENARRAWMNGLLSLRVPGEGFLRKPGSNRQSPYYNGEAWLALAHFGATFEDESVRATLLSLEDHLIAYYTKAPHIGFFHWGVMAAAQRFEDTGEARFVDFIEQQVDVYLTQLRPKMSAKSNTCYALEGLADGLKVLKAERPEAQVLSALEARVDAEISKNRKLQFSGGGLFFARTDRKYTRIDYTQHCLSALLKVDAMGR